MRGLLIVIAALGLVLPAPVFGADRAFAPLLIARPELHALPPHALERRVPIEILLCLSAGPARIQRCSHPRSEPDAIPKSELNALLADELGVIPEGRY